MIRNLWLLFFVAILSATSVHAGGAIEQVGYLKDKGRNRIFTFSFKDGTTEQEIKKHAERLPNTPHRMTAAYYYIAGGSIPAEGITLAHTVFKANNILYESPGLSQWQYAYMRSFKGSSRFINCKKDPTSDLCRQ